MLMNMLIFMYMFYMFMVLIFMSMIFFYMDYLVILEWMIFSFNSMNMEFIILLDWISLLFMSFIFLISSMIMLYSMVYMSGEKFLNRFNYLMLLFIFSMIFMVISPNILSILFGWDGLGVVSYCLVMYYQTYTSYNSAMVTILCNRIGDVGILMSISMMMFMGGWNLVLCSSDMFLMFMMLVAAITKSAQIPFSLWLPMAMAAPTPVSALVHSSTLVTAGVYLMIRFNKFLLESGLSFLLLILSVITMLMAGLMANFEYDYKKIIALSTLSQLGFMMMILSMGHSVMAFYHLLIHAIFKSMLFMGAGVIIHSMKNTQDIRLLGNLNEIMPFTMMSLFISKMALSGVPFMSGFYSKDLIMELVYFSSFNVFMLILIIMSLFFTVSYSVRMFYYLFFNNSVKFYSYMNFMENNLMNLSMMMMMMMSVILGSVMNWFFFFDYYVIYLSVEIKMMTLGCCILGLVMSMFMMMMSKILKFYYLLNFFSTMFFMSSMFSWIYWPINLLGVKIYEFDKSWLEFLEKYLLLNFLIYKFNIYYKFHMFMFLFIYIVMFMNLFM
uniref:NADH dehydrogenase subunit 5 n=1 Tax=Mycetophylax simplex TaxID=341688 RepID=UPI00403B10BB